MRRAKEQGTTMAVLLKIWSGPYATTVFREYTELLPNVRNNLIDANKSKWYSLSASKMLMNAAKDLGIWIVGGSVLEHVVTDKGDEKGNKIEKIYNTCLVLNPDGVVVAKHQKVYLFDIDVPGGISFLNQKLVIPGQHCCTLKVHTGKLE